jgi:AGZA family xanthine/uracil permease-like MFS transporter
VFVATIGLVITNVVGFDNGIPSTFGSLDNPNLILLIVGFLITIILGLKRFNFPAGMLVAIIVSAIIAKTLGIKSDTPAARVEEFWSAFGEFEIFGVFKDPRAWTVLFIFFIIDFFGSIGKFIGLTETTNLYSEGKVKNVGKALYVDSASTSFGALFGTSTIITFVESSVGIAAGGRTGLTAIVCGVLMLLSLAFVPLVGLVPVAATGGVLLYVGYLLFPMDRVKSGALSKLDTLALILMALVTLFTFSLDKALLIGFLIYSAKEVFTPNHKPNQYLLGATVALSASMVFQYLTF